MEEATDDTHKITSSEIELRTKPVDLGSSSLILDTSYRDENLRSDSVGNLSRRSVGVVLSNDVRFGKTGIEFR